MSYDKEILNEEFFRDRVPTVTLEGKRRWMYAWQPKGKFYNMRSVLSVFYLVVFFGLPFVTINGNPMLQLNVVEGKFSILGMLFWPQDFFIFGLAMVTMVVFVYLFTMIYGRLFCGWICPQTIFMEMVFRRIEWWIEGNPNKQRALKAAPWNMNKIAKKVLKHASFFAIAFLIANTFLSYIIGKDALLKIIREPVSMHFGGFVALMVFTFVFYAVYAFVREIVCTIVCPYGRLQGVLLDRNSIVVAYDYNRGEPRGKGKRPHEGMGDCVDCHQCVVVCPTGIDIRNGTQLECINCTACIDACNHVMDRVGLPQGLIRYASENEIAKKEKFKFSGRMKGYTVVLVLLLVGLATLLLTRNDVDATLMRARGQLFQEVGTDSLSNLYNLTLVNKTHGEVPVTLKLEGTTGRIRLIGNEHSLVTPAEGQGAATFFVILPKSEIKSRETKIKLAIYKGGKKMRTLKTIFLGYTE
jgi:cytochrome c oxidase accessory protein FixG